MCINIVKNMKNKYKSIFAVYMYIFIFMVHLFFCSCSFVWSLGFRNIQWKKCTSLLFVFQFFFLLLLFSLLGLLCIFFKCLL